MKQCSACGKKKNTYKPKGRTPVRVSSNDFRKNKYGIKK